MQVNGLVYFVGVRRSHRMIVDIRKKPRVINVIGNTKTN